MNYLDKLDYSDHLVDDLQPTEFSCEADAIYALYEELFDSLESICPKTILEAMRYLICKNDMIDQMEEIKLMRPDDLAVVHQSYAEKKVEEAKEEVKEQLINILSEPSVV